MTERRPPRGRLLAASLSCLALPLAAALASMLAACRPATAPAVEPLPARSNLLLITVDTLRADHLSSYGYGRATSPVIDSLAAEGVRFDQPTVQWPKTGPSFASLFTGTYPKDNGIVRKVGDPLPCRFRMLAEVLQAAGYSTHAVVANGALASDFYFDQGFDNYVESWKAHAQSEGGDPNGAEAVTRLATALLPQIDRDRPFFLWVHYLDPHFPYTPPEPARDRFQNDGLFDPTEKVNLFLDKESQQIWGIGASQVLDGRDDLAFYVARYDAEIAYTDAEIGRLLEAVRAAGLDERTLTVFTSDHGESLGDHRYYFDHGRFGFEACLRVPLIFHYPGVLAPRVDPDPVELIGLGATLLEAAGVTLEDGAWMQGRSLTPRLRGVGPSTAPPHLSFAEAGWGTDNRWQKVVRNGRFKLIYAETPSSQRWIAGEGVRFILYDLQQDPGETVNVAEEHPEELERLKRALWSWEKAERFPVRVDEERDDCRDEERSMRDETRKLLESLGYL